MVNYRTIAQTLVQRQLRIRAEEVVRITAGIHTLPFLEEIAVAVRQAGAFPQLDLTWPGLARRLIEEVPEEYLVKLPPYAASSEEAVDCHIGLPRFETPGFLDHVDPARLKLVSQAMGPVAEARVRRNARKIGVGFPSRGEAEVFDVPFERYAGAFWRAVTADLDRINRLCHTVRERLRGDRVQIVSPEGDELHLSIQGRRINMDDGVISEEDLACGDVTANLPFGEVYAAPVEDSVEGVARFPVVFHKGKRILGLRLEFRDGHLVHSSADAGHALFLEALAAHGGDTDRIGELGFGTNHEVRAPLGPTLLDEKIYGSIHLALGENRSYGGRNQSSLHWDMVMLAPTVLIDGRVLLDKGRFVL